MTTHNVFSDEKNSFAVQQIDEATMGLVRGEGSNAFAAFSKTHTQWATHRFPDHLTVKPVTLGEFTEDKKNNLIVAFELNGGTVSELVAVDCNGRFCVYKLTKPLNHELKPMLIGGGVAYYIVDEVVYAFSGKTGTWDSFAVPGLPDVRWADGVGHAPSIQEYGFDTESDDGIVVSRPNGVVQFRADTGVWQFTPSSSKTNGS